MRSIHRDEESGLTMIKRTFFFAFSTAMTFWSGAATAADWPAKTIHIVVPFGPAGVADRIGRVVAEQLSAELKQPVVVENRGGAGGVVGSLQVARAEPDGYTLLISGLGTQVIAPAINPNSGYDSARNFTHIAYIGGPPIGWVVPTSSDIRTIGDVVTQARAGKFTSYASSGVGTIGHLVVESVIQKTGIKINHVPYNTAALTDIIAGHVPMASYAWGSVAGPIQGGAVRAIGVTTEKRLADFPNVPTFKEAGYDLVARTWFALSGPAGLPKEIVQRLNQEVIKMLKRPDVLQRLAQDTIESNEMTPEGLTKFLETENTRWKPIAISAGMKK
jgi:tripartite-type tricarboxylate transporter receptor subunit TctC